MLLFLTREMPVFLNWHIIYKGTELEQREEEEERRRNLLPSHF